jgi:protoporphyrinogen oxidase
MGEDQTAIIIGAGPAGLTAAFELLTRTSIRPIVIEQSDYMGGISRTSRYKGNRIDIGGHRFFSKSDRVMQWWLNVLPLDSGIGGRPEITYQNQSRTFDNSGNNAQPGSDKVMLLRPRKSRIYFMRRFFDYPLSLSLDTLGKLGMVRTFRIGISYAWSMLFPIKPELSLEDFFINRFGRELYRTFFKSYTEKVWGVPCGKINAEWGAQRIKGLSVLKAVAHMARKMIPSRSNDIGQKQTETSLIEQFLYPKYGPGQMWEEVAERVKNMGSEILTNVRVCGIEHDGERVCAVYTRNELTGEERTFTGDYFFSTMPVKELIECWTPVAPEPVRRVSRGLMYRDFITTGLLCRRLKLKDPALPGQPVRDNWIYIQEPEVRVGRLQIFNNWSPFLVADPSKVWIGLEYFCYEDDDLWRTSDEEMIRLAIGEMETIGIIDRDPDEENIPGVFRNL